MIQRVKTGEPGAMLELWNAVRNFVAMKANERAGIKSNSVPFDDLMQSGFLAVVDAAEKYDPSRDGSSSFLKLLSFCLQTRFAEAAGIRSSKRDALLFAASIDEPAIQDDPDSPPAAEAIPDDGAALAFVGVEYADFLTYCRGVIEAALELLPAAQADLLRLRYFEGRSQQKVAKMCGLSCKQAVSDTESRLLYRLEHGKYQRDLRDCLDAFEDYQQYAYAGGISSFTRFNHTGISITEAAALVRSGGADGHETEAYSLL